MEWDIHPPSGFLIKEKERGMRLGGVTGESSVVNCHNILISLDRTYPVRFYLVPNGTSPKPFVVSFFLDSRFMPEKDILLFIFTEYALSFVLRFRLSPKHPR